MLAILLGVYTCLTPSKYTIELMRQRNKCSANIRNLSELFAVAGCHRHRCPVAAVPSSKWMLHTGGG